MTCKYCRSDEFPLDFNFCPICGREMYVINSIRILDKLQRGIVDDDSKLANEAIEELSRLSKMAEARIRSRNDESNQVRDENGNLMTFERKPDVAGLKVNVASFDDKPINPFDWENVDITREMIWLEADSIINGGNDEREEE